MGLSPDVSHAIRKPASGEVRPGKTTIGLHHANLVLIAYGSSKSSGEPTHPRSLARTSAARSYQQWIKRNLQTESQIPGPSEWLGMRSLNLSWRNAQRNKFAWRATHARPKKLACFLNFESSRAVVIWAISRQNVSSRICDQVRLKPACSAVETS